MKSIILIPSYEPDENLVKLIDKIKKYDVDIIVVNDGSDKKYDYYFNKIEKYAKVLSYTENHGKGYALKYGYKYIKEKYKNYIIVTMDSDGQHKIEDALKLIDYVSKNPYDIALGSRKRNKKVPLRSRIGNGITRCVYRLSTGLDVYDTQTGLRCFSDKLIDFNLNILGDRYEYEINVLLEASKNNINLKEIPIETIYIDNNKGSHFNTIKDSYRIYKEIIKFSFSSFISFIIDFLLYIILSIIFGSIFLANTIARLISGTFNYIINKKIVFNNKNSISKTLLEYILLATLIMILNTTALFLFVNKIGLNFILSKIFIELLLFIFSFTIQKKIIFRNKYSLKRKDKINV